MYTLLTKNRNSVEVLLSICNCFRNHCSLMVVKDLGRSSIFLAKKYPLTLCYIAFSIAGIFSGVIFWEKMSRISFTCILFIAAVWMYQKNTVSKIPYSDLYSNWLKKLAWAWSRYSFWKYFWHKLENLTWQLKSEIQKLHLNFKIRLKQKLKFEIYFLFFKTLKIDEKVLLG